MAGAVFLCEEVCRGSQYQTIRLTWEVVCRGSPGGVPWGTWHTHSQVNRDVKVCVSPDAPSTSSVAYTEKCPPLI